MEGEGCFSIFQRSGAKCKAVAIHCEMTDEDTIYKLANVFSVGTVLARQNTKGRCDTRTRKPTWIWSVQNQPGVKQVLDAIRPFMSKRRTEKIDEILEYINARS